jgi:DtxR family transcriptional regulator, Mn-dependent transcriptional regulator
MKTDLHLSENLEDYLETILELQETKSVARSKDIADKLDVKRGSVTGMLKKLSEKELINYEPYGYVTLTPLGKNIAVEIERKHSFLKNFFRQILGLDEETAEETACHMEHVMSKQTFNKFKAFIEKASEAL